MNDQRQVIFSQRLKILKENNITEMLNDFYEEILKDLEIAKDSYQKSKDEKYLTELKNITGNSLDDVKLKEITSKKADFIKEMRDLFIEKQRSRIDILGQNQMKFLKKRFFFKLLTFLGDRIFST